MNQDFEILKDSIDKLLSAGTASSFDILASFMQEKEIVEQFKEVPEAAFAIVATTIYLDEKRNGCAALIFQGCDSLATLISKMNRYKFYIYNIEFGICADEARQSLKNDLTTGQLSVVALNYFIEEAALEKEKIRAEIISYLQEGQNGQ